MIYCIPKERQIGTAHPRKVTLKIPNAEREYYCHSVFTHINYLHNAVNCAHSNTYDLLCQGR